MASNSTVLSKFEAPSLPDLYSAISNRESIERMNMNENRVFFMDLVFQLVMCVYDKKNRWPSSG